MSASWQLGMTAVSPLPSGDLEEVSGAVPIGVSGRLAPWTRSGAYHP